MKNANWYLIGFLIFFAGLVWLDFDNSQKFIKEWPEIKDKYEYMYTDQINKLIGESYFDTSNLARPYQSLAEGDYFLLHYSENDSTLLVRIKKDSDQRVAELQYEIVQVNIEVKQGNFSCIEEAIRLKNNIGSGKGYISGKDKWYEMLVLSDIKLARIKNKSTLGRSEQILALKYSPYRIPLAIISVMFLIYIITLLANALNKLTNLPLYFTIALFIIVILILRITASFSNIILNNNVYMSDLFKSVYAFFHLFPILALTIFSYLKSSKFNQISFAKNEAFKFAFIFGSFWVFIVLSIVFWNYSFSDLRGVKMGHSYLSLGLLNEAFILASANFLNNFRAHYFDLRRKGKSLLKAKSKSLESQSELAALQSRVNPHFLYNSLNSIAALAESNPTKTKDMALALSDFYKYNTNREDETWTTCGEEIEMTKKYLEIEKIRFGDKLHVDIQCDDSVAKYRIPKFLIQPLVENAIKYGYNANDDAIHVMVSILKEGNYKNITISVLDSGPDFPDDLDMGHGIRSVQKKLSLTYPDRHSFSFSNTRKTYLDQPMKGVIITLDKPEVNV